MGLLISFSLTGDLDQTGRGLTWLQLSRDTAGSMAWQVSQHQRLFVFKANWPMHPRYGVVNAAKTGAPNHSRASRALYICIWYAWCPVNRKKWQGREAVVSLLVGQASSMALPSESKAIKIASSSAHTNGSRASENFVAESLEGRRTHTRSVIVTTNGEKCGHWIQVCENTRQYVVFVQSAARHRKSLIFNKWSTCSVSGTHSSCHIQLLSTVVERELENVDFNCKTTRTRNDTNDTKQKFGRSRDLNLVSLWHKWGWQKQRKAHGNGRQWALCEARGEHRNAGYPYDVLSKSKHRIWMSSFSKHVPQNVCHNASVSFCNSSAWGQMLSDAKSGKQVGQCMLGLWMVECSKVATQHKRPLARLHALFIVDPGWTKVQEMDALIWPQRALWTN